MAPVTNAELAQQIAALQAQIAVIQAAQANQAQAAPGAVAQAPAAARHAPLLDPQKGLLGLLPQFDGMPGSDFRNWMTQFNNVSAAMKLTADEKMTLIPILLTDQAQDIYPSLKAAEKVTFDALKTALANKLVTQTHLTNALFQLFNRK